MKPPAITDRQYVELSPRLYNADLAPNPTNNRKWGAFSLFALWTNDVHNIANYTFAIGLFALGFTGLEILLVFSIGALAIYGLMNLNGYIGQQYGIPFPVAARISFGIHGAQLPAIIRSIIAIAWFGIQTYLASLVLKVLILAILPNLSAYDQNNLLGLGLSNLGWLSFIIIWVIQLIILNYGMEMVRKYETIAGPIILLTVFILSIWMLYKANFTVSWSADVINTTPSLVKIFAGAALWISMYAALLLNFCDFSRMCTNRRMIRQGNFWGLVVNMIIFALIAFCLASTQFTINGKIVSSPTDIIATVPNTILLVLGCLAFLIVTIAVNIMANFIAPAFALTNLSPKYLNFHRSVMITAFAGLIILPWNLYNSPIVINIFLGSLGALLGPLYGIIIVDYWIIRKSKLNVPDLYTENPQGEYYYTKGVHLAAIYAFIPAALISIIFALIPTFAALSPFSWCIGGAIASLIYYFLKKQTLGSYMELSGEHIALKAKYVED